ncbi:hypothetical protein CQA38_06175 [Campylobacter sp. MIT 12-5580]|uniref:hypothetical protein n=1 Tax=Campylobacter sp. MIT 12-5580 TaxID=2040651 RepID=UPI0010F445D0|nr:hypothetical protein [Campylobacter sp. MIT 12-5580]TKX28734.1 hypothetical protein CQA38_06175 [Campylobacter sp. MIT 12-5580]
MKKAIITGGSSFHQNFFTNKNGKYKDFFDEKIYLMDLKDCDLQDFDLLVMASRLHAEFLRQNKEKILHYLHNGGNIVIFPDLANGIFDHIESKMYYANFWWWILPGADLCLFEADKKHKIWDFLELRMCKWHYHGVFKGKNLEKILVNELGEAVICKDCQSFKGNLYLSALDPDFHLGQGFMPVTEPFFDGFMAWIEYDILHTNKV